MFQGFCKIHNEQATGVNDKGEFTCEQCQMKRQEEVKEYQQKKKSLLKTKKTMTLERFRQSKKRMVELQENLQLKMQEHFKQMDKQKQNLEMYFQDQQENIENFKNQQEDYYRYTKNGQILSNQDSLYCQVEILNEKIQQLEIDYEKILTWALTEYTGLSVVSQTEQLHQQQFKPQQIQQQQQKQQQQQPQQILEQIQYEEFNKIGQVDFDGKIMAVNKDNNIIAYSEDFVIKLIKIQDETLVKIDSNIDDNEMNLITCMQFGNTKNYIYYGNDNGKIQIWKENDKSWINDSNIQSQNGEEITDIKLNKEDTKLFTAGSSKQVIMWVKNGIGEWVNNKTFPHPNFKVLSSIAINSDETQLITSSFSQIAIWLMNDLPPDVLELKSVSNQTKICFIDDNIIFVHNPKQSEFYQKNDEQRFLFKQEMIMPEDNQTPNLICYNQELQILLTYNKELKKVSFLRFIDGKFVHQSDVQGEYDGLYISNNAQLTLLYKKSEKNIMVLRLK